MFLSDMIMWISLVAEISINNISLDLKIDKNNYKKDNKNVVEWFIIVIQQGLRIWATQAVPCQESVSRLNFEGLFLVPDITPDFRIILQVFSLELQQTNFKHEDKYHISNKHSPKHSWLSPLKFKRQERSFLKKCSNLRMVILLVIK